MAGTESDQGRDRLPDGSMRRRAEREAAAALAAELLLAAATKAAEALSAARLATVQRATARDLADRYRLAALEAVEQEAAAVELARTELAAQESAAAQELAEAREAAAREVTNAEAAASAALQEFEAKWSTVSDVASSRLLAAEELAAARHLAIRSLADGRRYADDQLAAAARLAASQVAAAERMTRAVQARELATAQADAAEELTTAQADAAEALATAQADAAEELATAARAAAEELAGARDQAAKEVAKAEEQFRQIMDWAAVAACTVAADGRFLRVNRAMCQLLDRSEDDLLGENLQDVTHPDDVGLLSSQINELLAGQRSSFRTLSRYLASDGRVIWGDLSVAAVRNGDGTLAFHIAQIVDVTATVDYEAALAVMATHDSLTGLGNRAAVLDEVKRALAAQRRSGRAAAVLVMDLDHFMYVNDSLGRAAGDELLKAAAERIESVMRAGDLPGRLEGDAFVLVMRDLDDPNDALRAAWRLVEAFRRPFAAGGIEHHCTASIGVAIASDPSDATDADDLLREADTAMHAAKAQGRDRVSVYNEHLRAAVTARLAIEHDLRFALTRGQLAVWYQPEVDLTTGEVIAVEALLRWHHPDGTVWTADRFIDVAEDTGLIVDIGDWVLRQACAQAAEWAAARPDRLITVRVNASALQLAEERLLEAIDDALAASDLNPALLCIEITETALLRETIAASANLAGIHERGVSIAIDDFGTGYASLIYLRRYPIDVIKIDRSFVTHMTTDERDYAIIASLISLANALGLTVTAEGVERPDQAALLRDMGCPGAQGWLYSKAVPADEATILRDHVYAHS